MHLNKVWNKIKIFIKIKFKQKKIKKLKKTNNQKFKMNYLIQKSKRDKDVLVFCNFKYNFKRLNANGSKYWLCREDKCTASVLSNDDKIIKINGKKYDPVSEKFRKSTWNDLKIGFWIFLKMEQVQTNFRTSELFQVFSALFFFFNIFFILSRKEPIKTILTIN